VDLYSRWQAGNVFMEAVSSGDLEGDQTDLPGPAGRMQGLFQPTYLQDEHPLSPSSHGWSDRYGVDKASVEKVLSVDLDGRQKSGHGAGGEDGFDDRAAVEPVSSRPLDGSSDALEPDRKVFDTHFWQTPLDQEPQRRVGVQIGAVPDQRRRPTKDGLAEDPMLFQTGPGLLQPSGSGRRRVGGEESPVQGADAATHHEVGSYVVFGESPQHTDFDGSERPAATEDQRRAS
jgi:hypothetical protein